MGGRPVLPHRLFKQRGYTKNGKPRRQNNLYQITINNCMKIVISIALTALMGFAAGLYFPWWSFAITSLIVALTVHQRPWKAYVPGFAGMFILWGGLAFFIDMQNEHILSQKVAN